MNKPAHLTTVVNIFFFFIGMECETLFMLLTFYR